MAEGTLRDHETASVPPPPTPGRWQIGLRWLAGLLAALGLLLLLALGGIWVWAGQEGSLARALD